MSYLFDYKIRLVNLDPCFNLELEFVSSDQKEKTHFWRN